MKRRSFMGMLTGFVAGVKGVRYVGPVVEAPVAVARGTGQGAVLAEAVVKGVYEKLTLDKYLEMEAVRLGKEIEGRILDGGGWRKEVCGSEKGLTWPHGMGNSIGHEETRIPRFVERGGGGSGAGRAVRPT